MNANENNRNGNGSMNTTPVAESSEPAVSQGRGFARPSLSMARRKRNPSPGLQRELPSRELKE